ncbi:glycoside hydrolase family 6 protein [Streptomyces sp. NPDC001513]|uniref:glycoside hydrolase family 6 protein n=1 Tax=Streptomyces sp. NPDC001513 TaxID=3364580 RepID=UPI0036C5B3BC
MPSAAPRRRLHSVLGLLLLLVTAPACSGGPAPAPGPPATPSPGAPAAESPYWVDPGSRAARQVAAWEAAGRNSDAQVLRRIADRPTALWGPGGDPGPAIRRAGAAARAAGRTLLLAAHNIPYRDCGGPRPGGAANARAYRDWIGAFADGIGATRAVVILEPGALAHTVDGCTRAEQHAERYRLLSEAVDRLKRNRNTKVYLDAGDPASVENPADLVTPLSKAGLEHADGFAVNVSGFQPDAAARAYGARISERTGNRHFVIDTGRNGAGPPPGDGARSRCNPPGRALGTPPTDRTADPLVDAYLWIKPPGESDGPCHGGPPPGTWWPDQALGLARRATE